LRSKRDAIGGAIKEANAEIVFERFDLKGDGGLCEKKVFRRLAKIEMFSNCAKNLETEAFQLGHVMIIPRNGQQGNPTFLRMGRNRCGPSIVYSVLRLLSCPLRERIGFCLMLADDRRFQLTGRSLQIHTAMV